MSDNFSRNNCLKFKKNYWHKSKYKLLSIRVNWTFLKWFKNKEIDVDKKYKIFYKNIGTLHYNIISIFHLENYMT